MGGTLPLMARAACSRRASLPENLIKHCLELMAPTNLHNSLTHVYKAVRTALGHGPTFAACCHEESSDVCTKPDITR